LNKAPKEVLQAFTNLRVSDDFGVVIEWLRENRKTARDELEQHTEGLKFARAQGKALFLKYFIETNESAPEALKKYK
jgi:hypothetical protein